MAASPKVTSTPLPTELNGFLMKGWFSEVNSQWPGQAMSLEVDKILFEQKSEYQHVLVFKSKTWGNVLVLDGVIQLTEKDEMAYQEMIVHLPLYSHPNPESVLIIGGGDGGVIRECVKHSNVKKITICEIDKVVIEAGKKYFPSVAAAWDDARVELHCGDGAIFMQKPENEAAYDIIICDSSDPVGPAKSLFETPFYQAMFKALKPGGKICTQAESMWVHLPLIKKLVKDASLIYVNAEYATTQIPTYPGGQIGLLVCSKAGGRSRKDCTVPVRSVPQKDEHLYRYYTTELHSAAFVLPAFVARAIEEAKAEAEEEKAEQRRQARGSSRKRSAKKSTAEEPEQKKAKMENDENQMDTTAENAKSPKHIASPKQTTSPKPALASPKQMASPKLAVASPKPAVASPKLQSLSPKQ